VCSLSPHRPQVLLGNFYSGAKKKRSRVAPRGATPEPPKSNPPAPDPGHPWPLPSPAPAVVAAPGPSNGGGHGGRPPLPSLRAERRRLLGARRGEWARRRAALQWSEEEVEVRRWRAPAVAVPSGRGEYGGGAGCIWARSGPCGPRSLQAGAARGGLRRRDGGDGGQVRPAMQRRCRLLKLVSAAM
jgi:hypothetical protein